MNRIPLLVFVVASVALPGCFSSEPTVIQPRTYQMSEQEQANRDRATQALAEHRQ
ncbi:hypothetical protein Enr13x_10350 [Stieleria neptunia]|uniref:Uncharacterized protein n=1 Tax=Stieleria neptunia TaxID=2527979 RepID=A0A518HK17_9BACT|nr:hypothetical protein [Stieleria neptunia]QDV41197.1 hypothetical protein Enr13x_10350 [Stieleria neptunia]